MWYGVNPKPIMCACNPSVGVLFWGGRGGGSRSPSSFGWPCHSPVKIYRASVREHLADFGQGRGLACAQALFFPAASKSGERLDLGWRWFHLGLRARADFFSLRPKKWKGASFELARARCRHDLGWHWGKGIFLLGGFYKPWRARAATFSPLSSFIL